MPRDAARLAGDSGLESRACGVCTIRGAAGARWDRVVATPEVGCDRSPVHCTLVSHTHWDREWYRTFESFRARLVDAIDRVLDLVAEDAEFRFLLDGQTIVLEDYLEIRPERRGELEDACRSGRIAIGPWYVQPDSLLPSGETHIRNLLEGRRVGAPFGGVSSIAYTPDSFGHPAQFPQILAGFGLELFVYWRGNGSEIDELPAEYRWVSPDGTSILAHHLGEGYFGACGLPDDPISGAVFLQELATGLAGRTRNDRVLLMNGIDHALPSPRVAPTLEALRRTTGWHVERGLLEDFASGLSQDAPTFQGELVGGRIANLLPGVWSARIPLKQRNRHAETALLGWAEPWAAIAAWCGFRDERPALRAAWRTLLCNQAHDSICGCSQDRVHDQGDARYDRAIELAEETTARCLERLAGLGVDRRRPWDADLDVAVFNPSPHARTDVVRFALEADAWVEFRGDIERTMQVHPLLGGTTQTQGYTADGSPIRLVREEGSPRLRLETELPPLLVEMVVEDVPAFGWKRVRLERSDPHPDQEDTGTEIEVGGIGVSVAADGTLDVRFGDRVHRGLFALEDLGDRGDTYDFDPVVHGTEPRLESVRVRRIVHAGGIARLRVERTFSTPSRLEAGRSARSAERAESRIVLDVRLAPRVERVDVSVRLENGAEDHRLRLLFPTGDASDARAATTSDVASRMPGAIDTTGWVHPAPRTFCHQGFVSAGGLTVGAPGLPEAEVTAEGTIALTLVRSVGWLALMDLVTRPIPAGPVVETPGAQCRDPFTVELCLAPGCAPHVARDAELGLRAVPAAEASPQEGRAMLELRGEGLVLEAVKPAEGDQGIVVRVSNPTDEEVAGELRTALDVSCAVPMRLDETPLGSPATVDDGAFRFAVRPRGLYTVQLS